MQSTFVLPAHTEHDLTRLAEETAFALRPGDLIALHGDLGAGKTTFARALIASLMGSQAEEIPSPTFTLVQTYGTPRMAVAHFDLYRLSDPSELEELGLEHALGRGIAIVEWPQRAAAALPPDRLEIHLEDGATPDIRTVTLVGRGEWEQRADRLASLHDLIRRAGWTGSGDRLAYLQGDASVRRYARLSRADGGRAVVMDWPRQPDGPPIRGGLPYSRLAHLAEDVRPFVAIADYLRACGLATPRIYAADLDRGLLVLEDFGDGVYGSSHVAAQAPLELWRAATDVLAALARVPVPPAMPLPDGTSYSLPRYSRSALAIETELLLDWLWPALKGAPPSQDIRDRYAQLWGPVFERALAMPQGWVLRDFHSPNLIWRPDQAGLARTGIIDFQDALLGPPAYDLVSLLQDARLDVAPEHEAVLIDHYCRAMTASDKAFGVEQFKFSYAALGAQRNSKILGIFARLAKRDGKPKYLAHMPRLWRYLARDLAHPELAPLRSFYDTHFPPEARTRALVI